MQGGYHCLGQLLENIIGTYSANTAFIIFAGDSTTSLEPSLKRLMNNKGCAIISSKDLV